jgi:hypothetical protein
MRAAAKSQQPPAPAPTPVAMRAAASAQHPPPHVSLSRPTFLAPDPVSVNNHARSSLLQIRNCRSTTEPSTGVPMSLPLRVPARLLLAWHKTTATQHVAARHLDHAFERLAAAHVPLVAASPLVDALRASPKPRALPNLARRLPLYLHRRGPLHFLRLFLRVFDLRALLPLSLSLTPPPRASSQSPAPPPTQRGRSTASSRCRSPTPCPSAPSSASGASSPSPTTSRTPSSRGTHTSFASSPIPPSPTLILHLIVDQATEDFTPAVEKARPDRYAFKLQFPPGFRLAKEYRKKVRSGICCLRFSVILCDVRFGIWFDYTGQEKACGVY